MDICFVALFYWGFGYAFAFGVSVLQENKKNAGFIGDTLYFYSASAGQLQTNFAGFAHMFFQFALAAASVSIISGAIAERAVMATYFVVGGFFASFVYPVVSHWVWSAPGWLCAWNSFMGYQDLYMDVGAIDFAGSGVIHLVGGTAAFFGAWWMGPRRGRFDAQGAACNMPGNSDTMQVMGTLLLWVGWLGINVGMIFTHGYSGLAAGRVAMNTILAGAAGAISSMLLNYFTSGDYNLVSINNGVLAGLVASSAGCATVAPWAAVVTGLGAGLVYQFGSWFTLKLGVDDVTDSVAVHGWNGIWGCVAAGLFSRQAEMMEVYGSMQDGLFYGGGNILAANLVLCCAAICWTAAWAFFMFGALHYAGMLRVSATEEQGNIDGSVELAAVDAAISKA